MAYKVAEGRQVNFNLELYDEGEPIPFGDGDEATIEALLACGAIEKTGGRAPAGQEGGSEKPKEPKPLARMNKGELLKVAKAELFQDVTNASNKQIVEAIEAARAAKKG